MTHLTKHLCHHVLLEEELFKVVLDDAVVNVLVLTNVLLQMNVQVDMQVDAMHLQIVEVDCAIERQSHELSVFPLFLGKE